jgi:hypothetical protein
LDTLRPAAAAASRAAFSTSSRAGRSVRSRGIHRRSKLFDGFDGGNLPCAAVDEVLAQDAVEPDVRPLAWSWVAVVVHAPAQILGFTDVQRRRTAWARQQEAVQARAGGEARQEQPPIRLQRHQANGTPPEPKREFNDVRTGHEACLWRRGRELHRHVPMQQVPVATIPRTIVYRDGDGSVPVKGDPFG